jgi:hypothetical protein
MSSLRLPSPVRAATPFAALCLAALALEADRRLWLVAAVAAALFACAGAARAVVAERELIRLRRTADRLILDAGRYGATNALVAWRADELTGAHERARTRCEVARTLRMLDAARLPSASPLKRPAARRIAPLLRRLEARLADERPVTARGVLLAQRLLRDADSPLYNDEGEHLLPRALARVLHALEP